MDKNKIIEAAAKLVAKGAYDKAIKEYQKILEADPKDVRILQKMGELYQKKNENGQAAHYFTKVAESYASDGFFLKAVALYKQVLKLDPALVDVNLKLAELHQQLQLMSEAMAYYQVVANHYDKQGDTKSSLDTLRKMVDLDPENVASRIKLAELYARENMNDEAVGEFRRAAEHLKRNSRTDDYLRVAERISALEPQNYQLARELADVYLSRGDQKRALAKLQICFKADSRDIDTLKLLAVAFQGLGQTSKTVSVYKELARVYQDKGRSGDAEGIWKQIEALDPNDADLQSRRPAAAPAPTAPQPPPTRTQQPTSSPQRAAAPPAAPQPVVAAVAAPAGGGPRESLGKLLTETDVYVKYGLHDKALEHLRKVFAVDPENIDAHEKAYAIYVASNNHAQAAEQLLNVLRLHTRRGDQVRAQPYLQTILQHNPQHPEVPVFIAALKLGSAPSMQEPDSGSDFPDDAILVDSSDEEIIVAEAPEDALADDMALQATESPVGAELDEQVSDEAQFDSSYDLGPPPVPDGDPANADVVSDFDAPLDEPAAQVEDAIPTYSLEDPDEGSTQVVDAYEPQTDDGSLGSPGFADTGSYQEVSDSQLSTDPIGDYSVSDYAGTDYQSSFEAPIVPAPPADPEVTGQMPAYQPPYTSSFDAPSGFETPSSYDTPETSFAEPEVSVEEAVEAPPEEEQPASDECDEASFFLDQGLLEEAREIIETILIAYPGHPRATELLARLEAASGGEGSSDGSNGYDAPIDAPSTGERDAFDLAAELASELGEMDSGADQPSGEVPSADYQVSVDEVFSEFKKGLEKVVKPEDVETHYDLGIAYKEMGLLEDAIGEFVVARQGCVGKKKEVDCLSMQGALQLMKGDAPAAVEAYKQALASEFSKGEAEKALRYELGGAYEQGNDPSRALGQYLKTQAIDPNYRDVHAMVERLMLETTPLDDDQPEASAGPKNRGPKGGGSAPAAARKVGYL